MENRNNRELRVYGIRRSGNHAIISWAMEHYPEPVVHLNDVQSFSPDPYKAFAQVYVKGLPFWRCKPKVTSFVKYAFTRPQRVRFVREDTQLDINFIRSRPKECLIHSYEDYFINDDVFQHFDQKHDDFVGESTNRYEVVILRDAYNLFASLIKSGRVNSDNVERYVYLYNQYAEEFVGISSITKREGYKRVFVNFNEWFRSLQYRRGLADQLGFDASGDAYENIPIEGGGSSFSGQDLDSQASELKVLERWKQLTDNPLYRSVFNDSKIVELTDEIFGMRVSI